jgi:hypothetical protein
MYLNYLPNLVIAECFLFFFKSEVRPRKLDGVFYI